MLFDDELLTAAREVFDGVISDEEGGIYDYVTVRILVPGNNTDPEVSSDGMGQSSPTVDGVNDDTGYKDGLTFKARMSQLLNNSRELTADTKDITLRKTRAIVEVQTKSIDGSVDARDYISPMNRILYTFGSSGETWELNIVSINSDSQPFLLQTLVEKVEELQV